MAYAKRVCLALLCLVVLSVCSACASAASSASAPESAVQSVSAQCREEREQKECLLSPFHPEEAMDFQGGRVDYSGLSQGYVALSAQSEERLKFQVIKGEETYTYDLPGDGVPTAFPLNMGSGTYEFRLMRCIGGSKYTPLWSESREVELEDEFAPFLRPSQMVNYTADSQCVHRAWEVTKTCQSDVEIAGSIYRYLVEELSYDRDKAASAQAGYLPDPDATLAEKKGICFDYAALAAAMLRSQGIPCQLITGYVGKEELYHAWNRFYCQEKGWITAEISVSAGDWKRVDITFASQGVSDEELENEGAYTTRYTY